MRSLRGGFVRPVALVAIAATLAAPLAVPAQQTAPRGPVGGIYSCIDGNGRRLTSDRPIPECTAREQRVHNDDGSLRRVLPPTMTVEERAAREAEERRAALEAAARRDAVRRDRNLMARYPDTAAHDAARRQALEQTQRAVAASEARLAALAKERKPLLDEAEFYVGRPLPAQLKQLLDANDVAIRAQREAVLTQKAELDRVGALFDAELLHLRRLWAGAAPGSVQAPPPAAAAPAKPAARTASPAR